MNASYSSILYFALLLCSAEGLKVHSSQNEAAAESEATQATPKYLGCFVDAGTRDLPVHQGAGQSLEQCSERCSEYQYFGKQWSHECWCGNSYGRYGTSTACTCDSSNQGGWVNCVYEQPKEEEPEPEPVVQIAKAHEHEHDNDRENRHGNRDKAKNDRDQKRDEAREKRRADRGNRQDTRVDRQEERYSDQDQRSHDKANDQKAAAEKRDQKKEQRENDRKAKDKKRDERDQRQEARHKRENGKLKEVRHGK